MLLPAQHADNSGFTLIEVMVAVIIMSIGLLALLQTVNLAIVSNRSNELRNDAIIYADEAVGTARASAFGALADSSTGITHVTNLGFVNYSVVRTITSITGLSPDHSLAYDQIAGTRNLQVRVAWREKGVKKTHSLTTTIVESAN